MTCKILKSLVSLKIFTLLIISGALAQPVPEKTFSKQFSFTMDNDFFMFQGNDGYYTNGLYFQYYRLAKKQSTRVLKKTESFGLNQMIFNAFTRRIYPSLSSGYPGGPGFIDRPITGYLFADYKQTRFYASNTVFQWGISAGTIGKASFGREVQTSWHKETGVGNYWNWAWNYQLKSEFGLNVQGSYAFPLIKNNPSFLQITPITTASLGTILTNGSQSVLVQLGRLNQTSESSYWNSRLQNNAEKPNNKTELFFFYKPQLLYQLYNATIQGGLFRKDKGPIVSEIEPVVITHELGVTFARQRYTAGFAAFYPQKEAKSQYSTHSYGRINVAYRF